MKKIKENKNKKARESTKKSLENKKMPSDYDNIEIPLLGSKCNTCDDD